MLGAERKTGDGFSLTLCSLADARSASVMTRLSTLLEKEKKEKWETVGAKTVILNG